MFPYDQTITTAILETSLDAAFTIRADGTILDANGAATRMFGWQRDELLGKNISIIMPSPVREQHDGFLANFDPARGITHILGSGQRLLAIRKDRETLPVEVGISSFLIHGERYFTGFVRDLTERQQHLDHLHHLATHDIDTGLLNYHGLMSPQAELEGAAALHIQLNGFHRIVAAHGRAAGEQILRTTATRLRAFQGDTCAQSAVARVGEAAFALFTGCTPLPLAERCQAALQAPIPYGKTMLQLTVGIGISGETGEAPQRLRDAMTACEHTDRRTGGILSFCAALTEKLQYELLLESRLHKAIKEQTLRMVLQPKIDLRNERIVGAEALIRWDDAELGSVAPLDFIPIAERTGMISDITDWMLAQSLSAIRRHAAKNLSVAVNFSAIDFRQTDVGQRVASALNQAGVAPTQLEIELTESIVADRPATTAQRMNELKELGVALSLDDFGTGYSSMSYLCQFPLDTLKIDASFVRAIPDNAEANAITSAIGALARALHLQTVAEGVETRAQAEFLKAQHIDLCQGFLYSRPVTPDAFHTLVEHQVSRLG